MNDVAAAVARLLPLPDLRIYLPSSHTLIYRRLLFIPVGIQAIACADDDRSFSTFNLPLYYVCNLTITYPIVTAADINRAVVTSIL